MQLAEQSGDVRGSQIGTESTCADGKPFVHRYANPLRCREQVDGIQQGDDILRLLSRCELATLGITELEYEFYRRLVKTASSPIAAWRSGGESDRTAGSTPDVDEQPRGPFIFRLRRYQARWGFNEQCAKAFLLGVDARCAGG